MKKIFISVLTILLLISCAAQAKGKKGVEPDWLLNPKKVYPDLLYLTAIGEGDSRTEAENYAASNLAKTFESRVSTDETYSQRYQELVKNDEVSFEDQTNVSKNVNINAEQTLYNIQFSESYTDKVGRIHVLAYINRTRTADIYEEKIETNSEKINYYVNQADGSTDIRIKYAAMSAAALISDNNNILLEQLDIISSDTKDFIDIDYNHNEISKFSALYARSISFNIDISNDADDKITNLLMNLFNDMGFVMSDDHILSVVGEINFQETDLNRDDFKFIRYELTLHITDQDNIQVSSLSEKGKEGHTTYFEAQERAVRKLEEKIKRSVKIKIINYFDSLVRK
jgi:LPP20 lipoprotein